MPGRTVIWSHQLWSINSEFNFWHETDSLLSIKIYTIEALETNRDKIRLLAESREMENDNFRAFISSQDNDAIDGMVYRLNEAVSSAVDCTQCGACCKMLMINVTQEESAGVARHLGISKAHFEEKYIEHSQQGQMIINTIPCHFLTGKKCGIYENRFAECRQFPHLERKNFKDRLFGTLMHYAICPIIFNVVEALKEETGFKQSANSPV